jgi:hypothetical protein
MGYDDPGGDGESARMNRRILSFGVAATHSSITQLGSFEDPLAISDYDVFVFDPATLATIQPARPTFERRQSELRDLITRKDGIVICLLRTNRNINIHNFGSVSVYGLLETIFSNGINPISTSLRDGAASRWGLTANAKGAMAGYFRVLQDKLHVEAFLEADALFFVPFGGTIFASNSVGYPVAVEFVVGTGRLCFVPSPRDVSGERVGAAIARVVDSHFGGPSEINAPPWVSEVVIPGASVNDERIAELERSRTLVENEISALREQRSELTNYRHLLFGYGKTVLEPVVRRALRLIGFEAPEPAEFRGEWDVELSDPAAGKTAIGEVEGSEGPIDVNKFRQLLNYFQSEVLEDRIHKAILIGNGYRTTEPNAAERQRQFTEHVLRGARQFGFCLLPTSDLFKAVCAVLESPQDAALKVDIRHSILSAIGVWNFAREVVTPSAPVTESAGAGTVPEVAG